MIHEVATRTRWVSKTIFQIKFEISQSHTRPRPRQLTWKIKPSFPEGSQSSSLWKSEKGQTGLALNFTTFENHVNPMQDFLTKVENSFRLKRKLLRWQRTRSLTRRFPVVSHAFVPAGAKLALFRPWEGIAREIDVVEWCGVCQRVGPPFST